MAILLPSGGSFSIDIPYDNSRCNRETFCPPKVNQVTADRALLGNATRWGEAKNPGPSSCLVRLGILNPAAVKNKVDDLQHFFRDHNLQMLCLSETAATLDTQARVSRSMKTKGVKCLWSAPVPNQVNCVTQIECDKGKPGGVAVFSSNPIRSCLNQVPDDLWLSNRFTHAIAKIGQMQFQLVVIYGYPQNQTSAKDYTNKLLNAVHTQVIKVPLPYLVLVISMLKWQISLAGMHGLVQDARSSKNFIGYFMHPK